MNVTERVSDPDLRAQQAAVKGKVLSHRGQFEQSVSVSRAAGTPFDEDLVQVVLGRFSELESRIEKTITEDECEEIEDEAETLCRLRAYICSLPEIPLQGASILSTMEQWPLPVTALDTLKKEVAPELKSTDLHKARAALFTLLKECDEWGEYQDKYNEEMNLLTLSLTGGIVASTAAALAFLFYGQVYAGIAFAGITGSCVSVISKIPSVIVSGDSAPYHRSAIRRLATGFVASMAGVGFLLSGMIPLSFPSGGTFPDIVAALAESIPKSPPKIVLVFEVMAVVTLLGISERALTSFEETMFASKEK